MGITTLNGTYLLKEVKKGFSEIGLGKSTIKQREFEGTDYNSFSNRCIVHYTPINGIVKEGDEIIVEHSVIDKTIQIGNEEYLVADEREIYGVRVNDDYDVYDKNYIRCFKPLNGFLSEPKHKDTTDGFKSATTAETESEENFIVDFNGVEVEFLQYADYEVFVNEKRYSFVPKQHCFVIDGVLNEDYFMIYDESMIVINKSHIYTTRSGVQVIRLDNLLGYNFG